MNNNDVFPFRTIGVLRPWPNSLAGPSSGSGKAGRLFVTFACLLWFGVIVTRADTHYVAQGGQTPAGDYLDWTAAASNIQDAISKTTASDTVLVSNGVYQTGGVKNWPSGTVLTNRVAITNAITVRSANNDPTNTVIKGAWDSATNGPAAVRCVYMTNGAWLIGFTLTNGATLTTNESAAANDIYGGGVWCESTNAIISNCVIAGNSVYKGGYGVGGGAYKGTLYNCTLSGNSAYHGGGSYQVTMYNCTLSGNSAAYKGGGANGGASAAPMYNCMLTGNSASVGGGAQGVTMYNCTIVTNSAASYSGGVNGSTLHNCMLTGNSAVGSAGGAINSTLFNCTLSGNSAGTSGGGAQGGQLINCIVYFNNAPSGGSNWLDIVAFTNTCTAPAAASGVGNITDNPQFVDTNTANYRLSAKSPCINAGTNFSWMSNPADARSKDLDGNRRIRLGVVDMGAYESLLTPGTIFIIR